MTTKSTAPNATNASADAWPPDVLTLRLEELAATEARRAAGAGSVRERAEISRDLEELRIEIVQLMGRRNAS